MVKSLAKSCALIAETLSRADLSLVLYPTPAMREALARLYAAILKFIVRSIQWYRKERMQHFLSSIANPWSPEYESELREVEQHARSVDKLAQSGSQAELRDAHLRISQLQTNLQATREEIKSLTSFVEEKFREITGFALSTLLGYGPIISNIRFNSTCSNPIPPTKNIRGHFLLQKHHCPSSNEPNP
jgi:hypothetical protein